MTDLSISKTRLHEGVWEGVVVGEEANVARLRVHHEGAEVPDVTITARPEGDWALRIPIPKEAIADGVHTLLVSEIDTDTVHETITLMAGEVFSEDLRAEIGLLRAELDMLKRAFRRHCLETN